jgi:hypothetical protein
LGAESSWFGSFGQAKPGVEPSCKWFGSLQGLEACRAWKAMARATAAAVEWFVGQQLMVEFESSWTVAWAGAGLESGRAGPSRAEPSRAESRVELGIGMPRGFVLGSDFGMSV